MTATDPTAWEGSLGRWGDYDRDDPFGLFEGLRRAGPVHDVPWPTGTAPSW